MQIFKYIGCVSVLALGAVAVSCNDDDVTIYTSPIISDVTTGSAEVTSTTATINGHVADLGSQSSEAYVVGVVYGTQADPITAGTKATGTMGENGNFTVTLSGLSDDVTYYYAAYVTLQSQITYYGDVKQFVTTDALIATPDAAAVTATSVRLGGTLNGVDHLTSDGSLEHGVYLAANSNVTSGLQLADNTEGANSYTVDVNALVPNTTYYYAAYMVLNGNMELGSVKNFTTESACLAKEESPEDYVNMGTKVEWARYNVGATTASEVGGLYGYGDVSGVLRSTDLSDYASSDIAQVEKYDVALSSGMGYLPTASDWNELIAATTQEFTTLDGTDGVLFTAANGNTLFFPLTGMRQGDEVTNSALAAYWTGELYADNSDYALAYTMDGASVSQEKAPRYQGLAVRPVRKPYNNEIEITTEGKNLIFGDLEGNGRLRIEIYNEYGSSAADPANCLIDKNLISFDSTMEVTFSVWGINGNLKDGAKGSYKAGLQYAADGWWPSRWSGYTNEKYDCLVAGDGTYTVWMEAEAHTEGAVVFCVDIDGLGADIDDWSKVSVTLDAIALDAKQPRYKSVTPQGAIFVNKDGDGVNGRIEIYNEYGDTGSMYDYSSMSFGQGTMTVEFTINGIDGNLKSGAASNYMADLSYAAAAWWPSYWGGGCGTANVTGDGTYSTQCYLEAQCDGAVVWCVEIYGLWQDLVNTDQVSVTINDINVPTIQ